MRFAVAFSCSLALHALAAVLLSLAFGSRGDSAADEKSPPSCVRIAVVTGEGASSAGESSSDEEADRGKTAAPNPPSAPRVAASGHTLFMPGSRKDYEELVQGVKDGIVSRDELKWNAHWLLETLKITRGKAGKE